MKIFTLRAEVETSMILEVEANTEEEAIELIKKEISEDNYDDYLARFGSIKVDYIEKLMEEEIGE